MSKVKWEKDKDSRIIGRSFEQVPEKYVRINMEWFAANPNNDYQEKFEELMAIQESLEDAPFSVTGHSEEAYLIAEEVNFLFPPVFDDRPPVSRKVMREVIEILSSRLLIETYQSRSGLSRYLGGCSTSEQKKSELQVRASDTRKKFDQLLDQGQHRKQAIMTLTDLGFGSRATIERHLKLTK